MAWYYDENALHDHQLVLAAARNAYLHDTHGVAFSAEPIPRSELPALGLRSIFLLALNPLGTSVFWFSFFDRPTAIAPALVRAWQHCELLKGVPTRVTAARGALPHMNPLAATLARLNVALEPAGQHAKRHSAAVRTAQHIVEGSWYAGLSAPQAITTLQALAGRANEKAASAVEHEPLTGIAERAAKAAYLAQRVRPLEIPAIAFKDLDWASGEWLWSWEATAVPGVPRALTRDEHGQLHVQTASSGSRAYSIASDETEAYEDESTATSAGHTSGGTRSGDGTPEIHFSDGDDYDDGQAYDEDGPGSLDAQLSTLADCRALIASWPQSPADFAKALGLTRRAIDWHLARRKHLGDRDELRMF